MGGSQALSRSLFAKLTPKGREAEYFSIYEVSDKGTSWLCPILFGLALQFTGSYHRKAILSLIVFLAAGLFVLLKVDMARGQLESGGTRIVKPQFSLTKPHFISVPSLVNRRPTMILWPPENGRPHRNLRPDSARIPR